MFARLLGVLVALALFAGAAPAKADGVETLPRLATVGPWTYATKPIDYYGRIWFANANRWPDHNSADIWSMKPDGSNLRRERRLFSQDVGEPVVHGGLLYWPYEDPRVSLGWGQIAVTDGKDWRVLETRVGRQFHLHGIFSGEDGLYLGGSSWNAQVLHSADRGATWSLVWEREREKGRFSRTYHVAPTRFGLVADLMVFGQKPHVFGLLGLEGGTAAPIPGWPTDEIVDALSPTHFGVYGLLRNRETGRRRILEAVIDPDYLGDTPLRGVGLPDHIDPVDLDGLTVLAPDGEEGRYAVWQSPDDRWTKVARLVADEPEQVRVFGNQPLVAGTHKGQATIWAASPVPVDHDGGIVCDKCLRDCGGCMSWRERFRLTLTLPSQIRPQPHDPTDARREITDALADPRSYVGHGIRLRDVLDKWVMRGLSGTVLAEFLDHPFPEGEVKLLGGRAFASHERFGRWVLTWGMRRAGDGRVPPDWLDLPFDEPENASQKYFGEKLAAIWTVAATGQDDRATMTGLRRVSTDPALPEWLRQDALWAIHVLRQERARGE